MIKLIPFYLAILIGVIWRFSPLYREEYGKWFTEITIWIFFPIVILVAILGVESIDSWILLYIGLLAIVVHVISYVVSYFVTSFSEEEKSRSGAQVMTATFPNTLLYPFPIIMAVVGDQGLIYATLFVFFAMILRNTLGIFIGVQYSPEKNEFTDVENDESLDSEPTVIDIKKMIKDMLLFPPFLALIGGFVLLFVIGPQETELPGIQLVKDISLYGSLIIVGISFQELSQLKPQSLFSRNTMEVAGIRFLLSSIIGCLFAIIFQLPAIIAITLIVQCMAPPAVANILYGKFFGISEDDISIYITSITFIALLILPLEIIILQLLFPLS